MSVRRQQVIRVAGRSREPFEDALAIERALEIRVDDRALSVTLRTLANGEMAAGEHVAAWDGADERGHRAPAGVYFSRLVFEGGEHVTRVVRIE